jgi:hypothetical protein
MHACAVHACCVCCRPVLHHVGVVCAPGGLCLHVALPACDTVAKEKAQGERGGRHERMSVRSRLDAGKEQWLMEERNNG